MKFKYDKTIDALYINLSNGAYKHSKKVTDDILVDVDDTGKVIGLEILHATENITHFNPEKPILPVITS